jgi:hypothetical protein
MQRREWDGFNLAQFLTENGMTPQVASRRIGEVNRSYIRAIASGYDDLSKMDLYDEETRKFYEKVAQELMRIGVK